MYCPSFGAKISFSSTLAASILTLEPEPVIGESLPSSLSGAEVVAMVEKSQCFLVLLDCGESLCGGVGEQRPILIAEQGVVEVGTTGRDVGLGEGGGRAPKVAQAWYRGGLG